MRFVAAQRRGGWGAAALALIVCWSNPVFGQYYPQPGSPPPPVVSPSPLPLSPAQLAPPPAAPPMTLPGQAPAPLWLSTGGTLSGTQVPAAPMADPGGSKGGEGATGAPGVTTPSSGPGADTTPLNDYWRYGLRFESKDKAFSMFVGGRAQFDVVNYLAATRMRQNIPGNVPLEDGVSFRRFRLDMGGTLYTNFEYYAQVDFFNGFVTSIADNRLTNVPAPTDLWVQFKELPWLGTVRVGNQKQPIGFEHLTSSRFLNFLERSLGFDAFLEGFNNGFAPGISVYNTYLDKRGTWAIGAFKNTRSIFGWNVGRNEAELTARITGLPVYEENGKYLVHVGLGASHRDLDQDQARFRSRLDARNSPSAFSPLVADTGLFFGNHQQLFVPELVAVFGPWSFQSEYYGSWVHQAATVDANGVRQPSQGTVYMQSVYGEVHLFLTGEHREYSRDSAAFTRVVPLRPFSWSRCGFTGCGAWQLAARYSYLDLIDKGVNGGRVHDMTLGVNWFLNPNMKIQFNYFLAHRNVANPAGDGFIQGFATRTAIDF
jgi:phosphate-selective porin OprO/OprP